MAHEAVEAHLLDRGPEMAWELFHENSKTSRHERHPFFPHHPSDATVVGVMRRLRTVKAYDDRPVVALPLDVPAAPQPLDEAMLARETARAFGPEPIELAALSKLLFCCYGVTRDNEGTDYPRPFRPVPSGGALYPLEVYVMAGRVTGLPPGLYHYDPEGHELHELRTGEEQVEHLIGLTVQQDLARQAAATLLVSAVFFRSVFKYGDRGYRFVLLEAGHLGQNAVLLSQGLGLAAAPVGGYMDRDVDRLLRLDGIEESVVYMLHFGRPA